MAVNQSKYREILGELAPHEAVLVAVSKTKPAAAIMELYGLGQRHFGENYVQELVEKQQALPADIQWHMIGHLQSNKVKYIAPFVHLIHGVDSLKLLKEIARQARKSNRRISVLLQVHIAQEETKFGFDAVELSEVLKAVEEQAADFEGVQIKGLMGMASFSQDPALIQREFEFISTLFNGYRSGTLPAGHSFETLSIGMSGDYKIALAMGGNMVRIGSLLFGARN